MPPRNDPYASLLERVTVNEGRDSLEPSSTRKRRKRDPVLSDPIQSDLKSDSPFESEGGDNGEGDPDPDPNPDSDDGPNSDSDNDSDFEDVSLDISHSNDHIQGTPVLSSDPPTSFSITIDSAQPNLPIKKKQSHRVITKEDRLFRLSYHKCFLILMLALGQLRNTWCNHPLLIHELPRSVPRPIRHAILQIPTSKALNSVKHRKLLDALGQLSVFYRRRFRVTCQGLIRKNWNELAVPQNRLETNIDQDRFQQLVLNYRGSRDTGAQGFVALCRSLGLVTRLVFSVQPPDYTSTVEYPKDQEDIVSDSQERDANVKRVIGAPSGKARLLAQVRSKPTTVSEQKPQLQLDRKKFTDSAYPIFWSEVWSPYMNKWISIDPIVLESLEISPMRRKSKFEPPLTETRNQLYYAIAYGSDGSTLDVTRRYSQYYNARTIKKKIQFRSNEDAEWYGRILRSANFRRTPSKRDIYERIEFRNRDLAEGIPNNLADFKNHPVYALESQLRQNEVIYPRDESSKCGTFRNKSSSKKGGPIVTTIYKRSHVYFLRPARAWYMRGRILKLGVQPLKEVVKKAASVGSAAGVDSSDNDEDIEHTRLYAEFQTQMYVAPPIENGEIPKNVYGNIDVYTESMLPTGATLIECTKEFPLKMVERAARIVQVDYAKAIVAFDFARGPNARKKVAASAREGGIVVGTQYKEAILTVLDLMRDEEIAVQQQMLLATALNNWRFFLVKLRIMERLNVQHGQIEEQGMETDDASEKSGDDEINLPGETSGSQVSDDDLQIIGGHVILRSVGDGASSNVAAQLTTEEWQPEFEFSDSDVDGKSACEITAHAESNTKAEDMPNTEESSKTDWQPHFELTNSSDEGVETENVRETTFTLSETEKSGQIQNGDDASTKEEDLVQKTISNNNQCMNEKDPTENLTHYDGFSNPTKASGIDFEGEKRGGFLREMARVPDNAVKHAQQVSDIIPRSRSKMRFSQHTSIATDDDTDGDDQTLNPDLLSRDDFAEFEYSGSDASSSDDNSM